MFRLDLDLDFHTHPPHAVRCLSLRSPCKYRVHLALSKWREPWCCIVLSGSTHGSCYGRLLSFTYLIKLNRTAVFGFKKTETKLSFWKLKPSQNYRSELQSSMHGDLVIISNTTNCGRRSFAVSAPLAWNQLPQDIRNVQSLESFKSRLETHLFNYSHWHWHTWHWHWCSVCGQCTIVLVWHNEIVGFISLLLLLQFLMCSLNLNLVMLPSVICFMNVIHY